MSGTSEFFLNTPLTICFLVHGIQFSLNVHVNIISTSRSYPVHQGKITFFPMFFSSELFILFH